MLWTVSRYLTRLYLARFAFLLLGLAILVVFLDFMADGEDVLEAGGGALAPILRYTVLRLPEVVSELIPIIALLAGFLTFAGLARHRELTAMLCVGISKFKLSLAIVPAALLIGAVQFVIEDQALPVAVGELRAWGVADYDQSDDERITWIRLGTDIVRIEHLDRATERLEGVTIFRRDPAGNLLERIEADSATWRDGAWSLQGVSRSPPAGRAAPEQPSLAWPRGPTPELLHSASAHPKETPLIGLIEVSEQTELGTQPGYRYTLWLHERLAGPVTTMILVVLTVALAQPFESRAGRGALLAIWLAVGFVAWTFDGLALTFGEIGLLPPAFAAWSAPMVFAAVAGSLMLYDERRKVGRDRRVPALG